MFFQSSSIVTSLFAALKRMNEKLNMHFIDIKYVLSYLRLMIASLIISPSFCLFVLCVFESLVNQLSKSMLSHEFKE